MSHLQFSSELINDILFRANEPTDGTSDFEDEALKLLNRAYRAVWMGGGEFVKDMNEPWLWLKKDPPGVLTLNPIVSGTASVTNNSTSVTLSATVTPSLAGRFFRIGGHPDVFRISAHTSGTAAVTLDSVYTGTTDAAGSYEALQLSYDLAADVLRLVSPMRVQAGGKAEITGRDLTALEREYPLADVEGGVPDCFALETEGRIRFNRAGGIESTSLIRVEYDYLRKPDDLTDSDVEEPLVPLQHRQILADIAMFYLYTERGDDRADLMGTQVNAGLRAMQRDNRARLQQISREFGRIYPRGGHTRWTNRVLRTESGFIIG